MGRMPPDETDNNVASEDEESIVQDRAWKYVFAVAAALAIAALPHSRLQDLFKMGVWTALFFGWVLTYTWPFLIDGTAKTVVFTMFIVHCLIVFLLYPRIPQHGYLAIGLVIGVEILLALLPIAWLDTRSQKLCAKKI
jgi:hypothetical protein